MGRGTGDGREGVGKVGLRHHERAPRPGTRQEGVPGAAAEGAAVGENFGK